MCVAVFHSVDNKGEIKSGTLLTLRLRNVYWGKEMSRWRNLQAFVVIVRLIGNTCFKLE